LESAAQRLGRIAEPKPLGAIAIECHLPVVTLALKEILKEEAHVYDVTEPPPGTESPSCIVVACDSVGEIDSAAWRFGATNYHPAVLVFGVRDDPRLARRALLAGARGFLHAGMRPEQIVSVVRSASGHEAVARGMLGDYTPRARGPKGGEPAALTPRQREILGLVCEGLSNAQIAERLFLTESTVKQHLYGAYKLLKVRNRVQAARLVRPASDSGM
jgi:DNA-binding NarL/FixJ family response regulator